MNALASNRYTITFSCVLAALAVGNLVPGCSWRIPGCDDPFAALRLRLTPANVAPLIFEANLGQADPKYPYLAHGKGHRVLMSATEAVFELPAKSGVRTVRAKLVGAREDAPVRAADPRPGRVNYFRGNDPAKWVTDIPTFGRVVFGGVYSGVDVAYHGARGLVENDFIVAPGGDPSAIRVVFEGADRVQVERDGSLTIAAADHTMQWKKPVIYQEDPAGNRAAVDGRYLVGKDARVSFELGAYDRERAVVIDPVVTYSTYLGTIETDGISRVVADAAGNAYAIGGTLLGSFPVTTGTYTSGPTISNGDVMLVKMSADGKTPVFTTHLGGAVSDVGLGIALDPAGNIYIAGLTQSADFPFKTDLTTKNILVNENCFVTKLSASGNALIYSTLIGGSKDDGCGGIAVDANGSAIVVGSTESTDFPTVNPAQASLKTSGASLYAADATVVKLSPDGTKLVYATYLGGISPDIATAVALDAAGNAYVTGFTTSQDFPATAGALQTTYGGSGGQFNTMFATGDAFVTSFNPSGAIRFSTYLGGTRDDLGSSIALDAQGNIYVAGFTLSTNFPTQNAFQPAYGGSGGDSRLSGGDGFIAELNPSGSALVFSSYLGGSQDDRIAALALDSSGNIWVAGQTMSANFPVTADAPQGANRGDDGAAMNLYKLGDAFLAEIGKDRKIAFATYLGGTSGDWAGGVAVDGTGGVIVAGGTTSANFPVSAGAYQTKYGGIDLFLASGDGFIVRYGGSTSGISLAGVSNAASFVSGGIAPGEVILVAGSKIGPADLAGAALDPNGRLATRVAGTRFLFDGTPAPIVYTSASYSSVIVPYAVAGKTSTQLVAEVNGVASPPMTIPVVAAAPGIFTSDVSGHGQALAYNADITLNSAQNPAQRGNQIVLFLTGEGQTTPAGVDGQITGALISPAQTVTVSFGGVKATDYPFVGEVAGITSGVLQINVVIPDTAPTGNVQVSVVVGSAASQSNLTVAIR